MKRARKGSGSVYRPKYDKGGTVALGGWRIRYRWNGKLYDQMVPADRPNSKAAAQEFLKQCFAKHTNGEFADKDADKLRYTDLRDSLLRYYEVNGKKSLLIARDGKTRYLSGQSHLDRFFEWNPRALDITAGMVEEFKHRMLQGGASNANINLSLGLLHQMFSVKIDEGQLVLAQAPRIKLLDPPGPRQGFLEPEDFRRLHDALDDDLKPVAMLGYDTGMRLGEISNLRWTSVDLVKREISLSAEETKTDVARTVPLGRILAVLEMMRLRNPHAEYVFGGSEPLGDFRKRWYAACVAIGKGKYLCVGCGAPVGKEKCEACSLNKRKYVGLTFHDVSRLAPFRRSQYDTQWYFRNSGHENFRA